VYLQSARIDRYYNLIYRTPKYDLRKRSTLLKKTNLRYNKRKHQTHMTPSTDQKIAQRYTAKSLEKKGKNKVSLQEELGWPAEQKRPVLCLPAGMSDALGGNLLAEVLPGLMKMDVQLLILGKGSSSYGSLFTDLAKEYPHKIAIIPNEEVAIRKMYAASDMALFLSNPSGMEQLPLALSYGVVPIAVRNTVLEDYNPIQEAGNSFLYDEENVWLCFAAIVRAIETHKFPYDWRTIQRQCMESVKSDNEVEEE